MQAYILWEKTQPSHGGKIKYDGISFIHLNKNMYECEYAKDHKLKSKVKAKEARAEKRVSISNFIVAFKILWRNRALLG